MRFLRHIALVLLLFALFAIAILFSLKNSQVVTIDFGFSLVDGRLAVWLLLSVGFGVALSLLALSVVLMRLKARTILLSRRLNMAAKPDNHSQSLPARLEP